ncbi:MAG TPA: HypC/HybG/HupF family hydrogenase formation chaperone [Bryobacteraceae bacterium]|nr:HypC/HybG/HupF family hydrogenase formation chaperone [Bryobacteraceae bacterium]
MCLAIPGKIVELHEKSCMRMGSVDYGGITREACLEYIADPRIGDYVLVHVGFAVSKVDEQEAARTYRYLSEMEQLEDLATPRPET